MPLISESYTKPNNQKMLHKLFILLTLTVTSTTSSSVLLLTPFGGPSHKIVFTSLAKALGQNGHHVSLVSVFEPTETYENVKEIIIPAVKELHGRLQRNHIRAGKDGLSYSVLKELGQISGQLCDDFYQTDKFKNEISTVKYDSIIIDGVMSECLLPVAPLFTSSVIILNTASLFPWLSYPLNVPTPYSFMPILFYSLPPKMSFWQRLMNIFDHENFRLLNYWLVYPSIEAATKKHFQQAKGVLEAIRDVNLVLVNADFVVSITRPEMPHIKHVGGLHLSHTTKPLPKDLAQFVESSGDPGVVLFSLGSIFDGVLTTDRISLFLNAFSKLKYRFLWKYNEKLENVPKNVRIEKWLPQQDLLAHPKLRLFITHGGLLSLQEAIYHQVPTVILPVFADQPHNQAHLIYKNASVPLYWDTLSVDNIMNAVTRAAEDDIIRNNVIKMSKLFKRNPVPPVKEAVYWVEYVMRYSGAPHLQSAAKKLNFFQYFSIDVLLFLSLIVTSVITINYKIFKYLFRSRKNVKID